MSPRRKSGLSPEDLQALKHLPAVLRALENLQEQHAKVRALMGGHGIGADFRSAHPMAGLDLSQLARGCAHGQLPSGADCPVCQMKGVGGESLLERAMSERYGLAMRQSAGLTPPTAILDTPERREYEAAKKAGKEVPPDLANISEAQRERMAEQRALIQAERQRKGLPPSVVEVLPRSGATRAPVTPEDERLMLEAVRVEELPATVNGSVGAEEE